MYKSGDFIKDWISGLYFFLTQFSGANFEQSKSCPLAAVPVAPFHAPKLSFAIIPRRMLFSLKRTYWGGLAFQESLTTCKCHLCSKNVPWSVLPSWSLRYRSLWPPRPQPTVKPLNSDALGPQIQAWTTWELFFRMSEMTRAQLQSYLAGVPGEQLIHLNPFALLMVVVAHPDLNVHGEDSVSRLVPSLLT